MCVCVKCAIVMLMNMLLLVLVVLCVYMYMYMLSEDDVLDVTTFADEHPGGATYIRLFHGKDATSAFEGGINQHTQPAHQLARMYRVAIITQ